MSMSNSRRSPNPRLALLAAAIACALPVVAGGAQAGAAGAPQGEALTVNSLADNMTAGDGLVTLREAIIAANTDGTTDLGQTASGADLLDLSALTGTIALGSTLPSILTDITVFGPGAEVLAISGNDGVSRTRLFFIDGGDLQLVGLTLRDGQAAGGAGATCQQRSGCGGGGGGLGGAAWLDSGSLRMLSVQVRDNDAVGGAGGTRSLAAGDHGGGGGGGVGLDGLAPTVPAGGAGAPGTPLSGLGGTPGVGQTPAGAGGPGAGGGAGSSSGELPAAQGGAGGFGGGGGGGGRAFNTGGPSPAGGDGGFAGGGGGRGARGLSVDGPGGAGGSFGGQGGPSSGSGNVGGGGGGGAGLGGAIFVRAGSADLQDVAFTANRALRGAPGSNGSSGPAQPGQGKGGALFIAPGALVTASAVTFSGNSAADGSGTGFVPGQAVDTNDVYGVIADVDRIYAYGFE
jgi:hypothetical protein